MATILFLDGHDVMVVISFFTARITFTFGGMPFPKLNPFYSGYTLPIFRVKG